MRNRGIEVFVDSFSPPRLNAGSAEVADLEAMLAVTGVPGIALPQAMVAAHLACLQQAARHHRFATGAWWACISLLP